MRENCLFHDCAAGKNCRIYERVSLKRVRLGDWVDINAGTYVENANIEDDVQIGPNCSIVGITHQLTIGGALRQDSLKRIFIGKKVFVGAGCVILPGIEIGEGAVVGAGTVLTKNLPSFHICVGVPPNQTIKSMADWLSP